MRGKPVELDEAALASAPRDAYGIPQSIRHAPQTSLPVWQYVHLLDTPIEDSRRAGKPYTHICVLCAADLLREHALVSPVAWTKALMRQRMSTNAVKHVERRHPEAHLEPRRKSVGGVAHPFKHEVEALDGGHEASPGVLTGSKTPSASPAASAAPPPAKRARKATKKALVREIDGQDAVKQSAFQSPVPSKGPTPPRSAARQPPRSSPEQILFLLHRWLISAGVPHAQTKGEELQRLLAAAGTTPALELSAPGAFDSHVEMEFAQFACGVEQYLSRERAAALDQPFAALQCDVSTVGGGSRVLGLSLSLVDAEWRHVVLPLAAQPMPIASPDSIHSVEATVQKTVRKVLQETYQVDVDTLQKFAAVNTEPAPALVKTRQEDDLIHAVSASLLHALGVVGTVQDGAERYSILWLEQSLEKLLAFFQDPARKGKLYQIGEFYHAKPAALDDVVANTRLGYLHELFKRSCFNFPTYSRYFATTSTSTTTPSVSAPGADGEDGERLWTQLSTCDAWQTIAEIEAVVNQLTNQLELDTLHPRRISSSYAHFFRRLLTMTLNGKSLKCLSLKELSAGHSADRRDADSATRESRSLVLLTPTSREFLSRLRSEIDERFGTSPSADEVKAMLLDPRIKSKAASLVDRDADVARVDDELRSEHRAVFMALAEREYAAAGGDDKQSQAVPPTLETVNDYDDSPDDSEEDEMSALLAMDGPSKHATASRHSLGLARASNTTADDGNDDMGGSARALAQRAAELEQAEQQAWQRWQSVAVEWEHFASGDDIFLKNGQYNVAKLYQRVDVLSWFRASGAQLHPSVAVLARAYLAQPAVASTAHAAFVESLGAWDVVGLHKAADVRREARLRVLQRNWRQWKELAADHGFSVRRGPSKRGSTMVV